jgi:hypothetical protein
MLLLNSCDTLPEQHVLYQLLLLLLLLLELHLCQE